MSPDFTKFSTCAVLPLPGHPVFSLTDIWVLCSHHYWTHRVNILVLSLLHRCKSFSKDRGFWTLPSLPFFLLPHSLPLFLLLVLLPILPLLPSASLYTHTACACGDKKLTPDVSLNCFSPCGFLTDSLSHFGEADWPESPPRFVHCSLLQRWAYRHVALHPTFIWVLGSKLRPSCSRYFTHRDTSPASGFQNFSTQEWEMTSHLNPIHADRTAWRVCHLSRGADFWTGFFFFFLRR